MESTNQVRLRYVLFVVLLLIPCAAVLATPVTYGFVNITNNDSGNAAVGEAQLFVDVWNGTNEVTFTFRNTGPGNCSISEVYFDDGTLLELIGIDNSDPGVNFVQYASPPNLPNGGSLDPPFEVTLGFLAESSPPPAGNGVHPLESVGIIFSLKDNGTLADVIGELADGTLRIGIHVVDFDSSEGSEAFVNVPEPATLLLLGLGPAALLRRRARRA